MLSPTPAQNQKDLFAPNLVDFIDNQHEMVLLAKNIDWSYFEKSFSSLYSKTGKPSMPLRFMVGCLLLKHLYNYGDETLAKAWVQNPYMQYFCGEAVFRHQFPCDPTDFVHFRKRIGKEGIEKIFAYTVSLFGEDAQDEIVLSDTTVQENNTTFPTAAKLASQIIEKCNKIAETEGVEQRQTYKKVTKDLMRQTHNAKHPKRAKNAKKARQKLQRNAGRLIRELERKLPEDKFCIYQEDLNLFREILTQDMNKKGSEKIYSLHKRFTECIAKGKPHKRYEFGNKVGLLVSSKHLIVTGIEGFKGNPHDSKTIAPLLEQTERLTHFLPKEVVYDRGGRGKVEYKDVKVSIPSKPKKSATENEKRKARKKFRRRAAIEPVIGHLKKAHRMGVNYYWGEDSPTINAMLAAAAWNLRKYMKMHFFSCFIFHFQRQILLKVIKY